MIKRKVLSINGTLVASIPRDICDLMGVVKGAFMEVDYNQAKNQVIFTPVKEK